MISSTNNNKLQLVEGKDRETKLKTLVAQFYANFKELHKTQQEKSISV